MVTADYYYPNWGCNVDFFAIQGLEIAGMAGNWTDNLLSQVPMTYQPHGNQFNDKTCFLQTISFLKQNRSK